MQRPGSAALSALLMLCNCMSRKEWTLVLFFSFNNRVFNISTLPLSLIYSSESKDFRNRIKGAKMTNGILKRWFVNFTAVSCLWGKLQFEWNRDMLSYSTKQFHPHVCLVNWVLRKSVWGGVYFWAIKESCLDPSLNYSEWHFIKDIYEIIWLLKVTMYALRVTF